MYTVCEHVETMYVAFVLFAVSLINVFKPFVIMSRVQNLLPT